MFEGAYRPAEIKIPQVVGNVCHVNIAQCDIAIERSTIYQIGVEGVVMLRNVLCGVYPRSRAKILWRQIRHRYCNSPGREIAWQGLPAAAESEAFGTRHDMTMLVNRLQDVAELPKLAMIDDAFINLGGPIGHPVTLDIG